jgi:tRNA(Ile)-lysidine synthase
MHPIGMKGSKLISDIIKDDKTPSNKKKDVLVLLDDQKILWCVNIRCGKEALANDESESIWKIEVRF